MARDMAVSDIKARSDYIAFFDECGDHSMSKIDPDFPLFVLSAVVATREDYVNTIIPSMGAFKLRYWNHEGSNLHSRDIRKAAGPFRILQHPGVRAQFLGELSVLMERLPFYVFVVGIRKDRHVARYGASADNPYELALTFVMERIVFFLESKRQTALPIVAESRGKKEDTQLEAAFYRLTTDGTRYVDQSRFRGVQFPIEFRDKRTNIAGVQLADMCAHPSARHILNPSQPNHAYEIVEKHVCQEGTRSGWKVFP